MNMQVGVKLLIQAEDGSILLIKRRGYDELDGTWDIPGGRISPEEPLLEALRREVSEEIGATFTSTPTLIAAQDIFPPGRDLHVVRLTYMITESVPVGPLSDEHSEARYILLDQTHSLVIDPLVRELLDSSSSLRQPTDLV